MKPTHRQHHRLRNKDRHVKLYSYVHYGIAKPLNRASNLVAPRTSSSPSAARGSAIAASFGLLDRSPDALAAGRFFPPGDVVALPAPVRALRRGNKLRSGKVSLILLGCCCLHRRHLGSVTQDNCVALWDNRVTICLQGCPLLLCSLLLLAVLKGGFRLFLRLNLILFGLCLHLSCGWQPAHQPSYAVQPCPPPTAAQHSGHPQPGPCKKGQFMGQVWRHTPMINTGRLMQVPIKQLQTLWRTYHSNLPERKVISQTGGQNKNCPCTLD